MKRLLLLVPLLLLGGCHKKNPDGSPVGVGSLPGNCTVQSETLSGAIVEGSCAPGVMLPCTNKYQYVATKADVIDHPSDRVDVVLHGLSGDRTIPSTNIQLGHNQVMFLNAFEAGFTSYDIQDTICR